MDSFDDLLEPAFGGASEEPTGINMVNIHAANGVLRFEKEMEKSKSGKQMYIRSLNRTVHPDFLGISVDDRPHYLYNVNIEEVVGDSVVYEFKEAGYIEV